MSVEPERLAGDIYGTWQQPVNLWQGAPNSIHTDSVARKVGMRGGTIPGSSHLAHFRPLLTHLFGQRWYRNSTISMYYTYATVDREAVRAVVKAPAATGTDAIVDAWVETREGKVVCKGTLSVGKPARTPYVRSLPLENTLTETRRILSRMRVGDAFPTENNCVLTEGGEGGALRDPVQMFRALRCNFVDQVNQPAVGFYGATEVVLHEGPIKTDVPYVKTGKIVCVGNSAKTEFAWVDSQLHDREGRLIAEMRHLTRWMKVSSPLWAAA